MRRRTVTDGRYGWLVLHPDHDPPTRCSWCLNRLVIMGTQSSWALICLICEFTVTDLTCEEADA